MWSLKQGQAWAHSSGYPRSASLAGISHVVPSPADQGTQSFSRPALPSSMRILEGPGPSSGASLTCLPSSGGKGQLHSGSYSCFSTVLFSGYKLYTLLPSRSFLSFLTIPFFFFFNKTDCIRIKTLASVHVFVKTLASLQDFCEILKGNRLLWAGIREITLQVRHFGAWLC